MRITLVGPGIMPIPPKGWGAVEILISDLASSLQEIGHIVTIVNESSDQDIIRLINSSEPDIVHFHYDQHIKIIKSITCNNIFFTSHFPYTSDFLKIKNSIKNITARIILEIITRIKPDGLRRAIGISDLIKSLRIHLPLFKLFLRASAEKQIELVSLSSEIYSTYAYFNKHIKKSVW